jgi:hypothetical protein
MPAIAPATFRKRMGRMISNLNEDDECRFGVLVAEILCHELSN